MAIRVSAEPRQDVSQLIALPTLYTADRCFSCRALLEALGEGFTIGHNHYRITTPHELIVMKNMLDVDTMPVLVMPNKEVITGVRKIARVLGGSL